MNEDIINNINKLKTASLLDIPNIIQEIELYDKESAEDIFEQVSQEMEKGDMIDNVVTPVMTTVVDSLFQHPKFKGIARKSGLSATRVMQECKTFNYEGRISYLLPDSVVDSRNQAANAQEWGEEHRPEYVRELYHDLGAMNRYKNKRIEENEGRKNLKDEYTGKKDIAPKKNDPDKRRNDQKKLRISETDHGVPLKMIFERFQNNMGLSDGDIKRISNKDYNFALTSREINNAKRARSNSEFIKLQDKKKAEGKPYIELSPETRATMLKVEKEAMEAIEREANATVITNIRGKGQVDRPERKAAMKKEEEKLGRKLTNEERKEVDKRLGIQKALGIHKENAVMAGKQTLGYAIGSSILFIIKPLYYEIKDGIINGFKGGVMAETYKQAFKIRFQRIKDYVWEQLTTLKELLASGMEMLANFVNALIEGLIGMFVGVFRSILKIIKEGTKVFVESWPILFGKDSKQMSPAQKGDAIIKILGGVVVAILGTFLDDLVKTHATFIPEEFRVIVSTLLTGTASVLLFYALDKADLFNAKKERRETRINEVFEERKRDIENACKSLNEAVSARLVDAYSKTSVILNDFAFAIKGMDYESASLSIMQLSNTIGVKSNYSSLSEFQDLKKNNKLNWEM